MDMAIIMTMMVMFNSKSPVAPEKQQYLGNIYDDDDGYVYVYVKVNHQ